MLWETGNHEARLLAILVLTPKKLSREQLDRIEAEMGGAPPAEQWTMNFCLAGIGIHFPERASVACQIEQGLS